MRFNSVKSGNFTSAARAVNRSADQMFAASRDSAPDYSGISKAAIASRTKERNAATQAQGLKDVANIKADNLIDRTKLDIKTEKDVADIKRPAKRMAGVVAGLGSISTAAMLAKDNREAKAERLQFKTERDAITAKQTKMFNEQQAATTKMLETLKGSLTKPDTPKPPTGTDSASTSVPTSSSNTDLSSLTPDDYKHLAYAVSSEAGPGKDRYAVTASILNRVKSDKFPNTVKDVIYADGQYEGVYKGLSKDSPDIAADLSSPEGQSEILSSLKLLDGRTDFKGQTQLHNRSNKGNKDGIMDPMVDPKGNFFHYHWQ